MRSRLLVLPLLLAAFATFAPARAAADDGAAIRRNYVAPIAGTPLSFWDWQEPSKPRQARSPALVIAGAIFGGLGAAGAITGLVLTGNDQTHDVGFTTLLGSAGAAAIGLTMVLVGIQPAEEPAATSGRSLAPSVAVGPTGGALTWRF